MEIKGVSVILPALKEIILFLIEVSMNLKMYPKDIKKFIELSATVQNQRIFKVLRGSSNGDCRYKYMRFIRCGKKSLIWMEVRLRPVGIS